VKCKEDVGERWKGLYTSQDAAIQARSGLIHDKQDVLARISGCAVMIITILTYRRNVRSKNKEICPAVSPQKTRRPSWGGFG
jgi:hypothetical protein